VLRLVRATPCFYADAYRHVYFAFVIITLRHFMHLLFPMIIMTGTWGRSKQLLKGSQPRDVNIIWFTKKIFTPKNNRE